MNEKKSAVMVAGAGITAAIALYYYNKISKRKPIDKARECTEITDEMNEKEDLKNAYPELMKFFPEIKQRFIHFLQQRYNLERNALERVEKLLDYTCVGGKANRGVLVCHSTRYICSAKKLNYKERLNRALVLAWSIEILQACFLVADDIMDASLTRRGKACWYKLPEVGLDAVNDSLLLLSFINFLLKEYFQHEKYYTKLVHLFNQTSLDTEIGQMLDLASNPHTNQSDVNKLATFNAELYQKIVKYKTAYYSFFLPVACALLICGIGNEQEMKVAEDICIQLGEKFQIQDDYLDCFGDPDKIGKIGTDIQDHKCTWLIIQALLLASLQQRKMIELHYGHQDEKSIMEIKKIYEELNLKQVYEEQELKSYQTISSLAKQYDDLIPSNVFLSVLEMIHMRQK